MCILSKFCNNKSTRNPTFSVNQFFQLSNLVDQPDGLFVHASKSLEEPDYVQKRHPRVLQQLLEVIQVDVVQLNELRRHKGREGGNRGCLVQPVEGPVPGGHQVGRAYPQEVGKPQAEFQVVWTVHGLGSE